MIGRTLSAVTLEQPGFALTTNFLKIEMAQIREPNRLLDLRLAGLSDVGMREECLLPILK
jgi:hypothetical protein